VKVKPKVKRPKVKSFEDAKAKVAELKANIEELAERLREREAEIEALRKRIAENPPPPEFDQAWARENRALTRRLAAAQRERTQLYQAKMDAEHAHRAYLELMRREAEKQLEADRLWWESRRREYLDRQRGAEVQEAASKVAAVIDALRADITDEDSAARVREALQRAADPEIEEAARLSGRHALTQAVADARRRLNEWILSHPGP